MDLASPTAFSADFWPTLGAALGLAIAIEGLLYALFPDVMRRALALAFGLPEAHLRMAGLTAAALGVGVVWLVLG